MLLNNSFKISIHIIYMSRHQNLLKELGLTKTVGENNKIQNLLEVPLKDTC